MRDRRHHEALAKIVTIRAAERVAARHQLFLAGERERKAIDARRRADDRTRDAAEAWQDRVSGAAFHPELVRALAGQLIERAGAGDAARDHEGRMTGEREASEGEWQLGDARCRQAERAFDASRRARARAREDRALDAIADRVTFDWTRP